MVVAEPDGPNGAVVVVGTDPVPPSAGSEVDVAGNDEVVVVVVARGLRVVDVVGLVDGVSVVDVAGGRVTVV